MGMFDTLRSSYDIGPGFWDKELQTKDLGSFMAHYWIDPAGRLFRINYDGTHDWDINPAFGWDAVPNGNHGKVSPVIFTGEIEVYPSKWDCKYAPFPTKHLKFFDGVLQ